MGDERIRLEVEGGKHYLHLTHRSPSTEDGRARRASLKRLPEERVVPVTVFMGIDPASSIRPTADRTAIVCVAVDEDDNRYVLPYFADRVPPSVVAVRAEQNHERYRPLKTRVETTAYQEMLAGALRGKIPGLVGEKPRASKSEPVRRMVLEMLRAWSDELRQAVGDRVFHQKFGYGSVAAIEGDKLAIDFEKAGRKNVVARFVTAAEDVPF